MANVLYNISQILGITLIHSLWQGLLIYAILRIIFAAAGRLSPEKKYYLAIIAISVLFFGFLYTLLAEVRAYHRVALNPIQLPSLLILTVNTQQFAHSHFNFYNAIARYLPYVSVFYMAGLIFNLVRLSNEWKRIKTIKRSLIPAEQMQQYINTFSKLLGIKKHIQIKFSTLIDVPCITGYLKPIIFLPVSLATSLTACEIEAILLHELSHIKRKDYLVNLIQQFITIILFFNPFAQLINGIINRERENGCDDLVIEKTDNPLIYAYALLKLEENRQTGLQLTLSATGERYHLLNRIERIMKTQQPAGNFKLLLIILFLLTASLSGLAWFNPKPNDQKSAEKIIKPAATAISADQLATANTGTGNHPKPKYRKFSVKDSNKFIQVTDTSKRNKKKIKTTDTIVDLSSDIEWQSRIDTIRGQSEAIQKQFNTPEWKSQVAAMRKQGEEIRKQFNSPQWKIQVAAMRKQAEAMKKQFNSPEWKSQMLAMKKQGDEMKKQFDSPEWKQQMEDIQKQSEEINKQFNSPEWKQQMEDIKKQSEEIKKQFSSPEWKKQMEEMKKQSEEIKKQFQNKDWYLKDSTNNIYIERPKTVKKKKIAAKAEKTVQPVN